MSSQDGKPCRNTVDKKPPQSLLWIEDLPEVFQWHPMDRRPSKDRLLVKIPSGAVLWIEGLKEVSYGKKTF